MEFEKKKELSVFKKKLTFKGTVKASKATKAAYKANKKKR